MPSRSRASEGKIVTITTAEVACDQIKQLCKHVAKKFDKDPEAAAKVANAMARGFVNGLSHFTEKYWQISTVENANPATDGFEVPNVLPSWGRGKLIPKIYLSASGAKGSNFLDIDPSDGTVIDAEQFLGLRFRNVGYFDYLGRNVHEDENGKVSFRIDDDDDQSDLYQPTDLSTDEIAKVLKYTKYADLTIEQRKTLEKNPTKHNYEILWLIAAWNLSPLGAPAEIMAAIRENVMIALGAGGGEYPAALATYAAQDAITSANIFTYMKRTKKKRKREPTSKGQLPFWTDISATLQTFFVNGKIEMSPDAREVCEDAGVLDLSGLGYYLSKTEAALDSTIHKFQADLLEAMRRPSYMNLVRHVSTALDEGSTPGVEVESEREIEEVHEVLVVGGTAGKGHLTIEEAQDRGFITTNTNTGAEASAFLEEGFLEAAIPFCKYEFGSDLAVLPKTGLCSLGAIIVSLMSQITATQQPASVGYPQITATHITIVVTSLDGSNDTQSLKIDLGVSAEDEAKFPSYFNAARQLRRLLATEMEKSNSHSKYVADSPFVNHLAIVMNDSINAENFATLFEAYLNGKVTNPKYYLGHFELKVLGDLFKIPLIICNCSAPGEGAGERPSFKQIYVNDTYLEGPPPIVIVLNAKGEHYYGLVHNPNAIGLWGPNGFEIASASKSLEACMSSDECESLDITVCQDTDEYWNIKASTACSCEPNGVLYMKNPSLVFNRGAHGALFKPSANANAVRQSNHWIDHSDKDGPGTLGQLGSALGVDFFGEDPGPEICRAIATAIRNPADTLRRSPTAGVLTTVHDHLSSDSIRHGVVKITTGGSGHVTERDQKTTIAGAVVPNYLVTAYAKASGELEDSFSGSSNVKLAAKYATTLVIYKEGSNSAASITGCSALFWTMNHPNPNNSLEICWLAFISSGQIPRKGYGTILLWCLAEALHVHSEKIEEIYLSAMDPSITFWEKVGFNAVKDVFTWRVPQGETLMCGNLTNVTTTCATLLLKLKVRSRVNAFRFFSKRSQLPNLSSVYSAKVGVEAIE